MNNVHAAIIARVDTPATRATISPHMAEFRILLYKHISGYQGTLLIKRYKIEPT